eukprot:PhM_4_TR3411/c1_g2_i1/m.82457
MGCGNSSAQTKEGDDKKKKSQPATAAGDNDATGTTSRSKDYAEDNTNNNNNGDGGGDRDGVGDRDEQMAKKQSVGDVKSINNNSSSNNPPQANDQPSGAAAPAGDGATAKSAKSQEAGAAASKESLPKATIADPGQGQDNDATDKPRQSTGDNNTTPATVQPFVVDENGMCPEVRRWLEICVDDKLSEPIVVPDLDYDMFLSLRKEVADARADRSVVSIAGSPTDNGSPKNGSPRGLKSSTSSVREVRGVECTRVQGLRGRALDRIRRWADHIEHMSRDDDEEESDVMTDGRDSGFLVGVTASPVPQTRSQGHVGNVLNSSLLESCETGGGVGGSSQCGSSALPAPSARNATAGGSRPPSINGEIRPLTRVNLLLHEAD